MFLVENNCEPIAVILIRSGSTGIKNKNIVRINNKPLVFYTIKTAIESDLFASIWVSSDSEEYLNICKNRFPDIKCVLRSKELSKNTSSTLDTLKDFLQKFEDNQIFINLQATSPIRTTHQLKEAYNIYLSSEADHLVSYVKTDKSKSLFTKLKNDNFILPPEIDKHYARQKEPIYYYPNGSIWISSKKKYLEDETFYTKKTIAYIMDKLFSYDIDDDIDLEINSYFLSKKIF